MRVAAAVLVLCVGCATPYPATWARAGANDEALRIESAQCRVTAMSGSSAQQDGTMGYVMAKSIFRDCMIGKGWTSTAAK